MIFYALAAAALLVSVSQSLASCEKDTDCKGDRVCVAGECSSGGGVREARGGPTPHPPSGANACKYANDGECDEPTLCPAGTDSDDCATP
jgi:hypothetical protein